MSNLFRQEVLDSKKNRQYGSVSINTPPAYQVVAWIGIGLIVLLGLFVSVAEFCETFVVPGYLTSSSGMVRVFAAKQGVIVAQRVQQGQRVNKGDELFVISDDSENDRQVAVLANLKQAMALVDQEIKTRQNELQQLKPLLLKKYLSRDTYNSKRDGLRALEKEKNALDRERISVQKDRHYSVRAPVDGVISSVLYKVGQTVGPAKPLLQLLPDNAELVAELYVPVKQSGFLNKNNPLMLRYDAFPYERFGSYKAVIESISRSILLDDEDDKPVVVGQPYYKVLARLGSPYVRLYGRNKRLRHGMTVSAVLTGQKRTLWQWAFDPVYRVYGAL